MDYITTANVLATVFIVLGFLLVFLSHWLSVAALFPKFVDRCASHYRRPVVTTLIGFLLLFVPVTIGGAINNVLPAALKWIGVVIMGLPILIGLFGSAGLAQRIGAGMPTEQDHTQPWRRVLRGGTVLSLTFLLPIVGQVLVLPLVLASGMGTAVFAWVSGLRQSAPQLAAGDSPVASA